MISLGRPSGGGGGGGSTVTPPCEPEGTGGGLRLLRDPPRVVPAGTLHNGHTFHPLKECETRHCGVLSSSHTTGRDAYTGSAQPYGRARPWRVLCACKAQCPRPGTGGIRLALLGRPGAQSGRLGGPKLTKWAPRPPPI